MPVLSFVSLLVFAQTPVQAPPRDSARDSIASQATRTVLPGRQLLRLPVDDPRAALTLVPGVALRGDAVGIGSGSTLSVRLGTRGAAGVYIDGAPASLLLSGEQGATLSSDALEAVAVTTGLPDASIDQGRGGVIEYVIRSGGTRLAGHALAHTDALFGSGSSVGYNRFSGSASGPLGARLSWFASGELTGQRSAYRGLGAADQPAFVWGGVDTTVDTVTIPTFVESRELRRPLDWVTQRRAVAKMVYGYGSSGSLALTGIASDRQQRFYPGAAIGDPGLFSGARQWSRLVVLNWSQPIRRAHPFALHATVSLGQDRAAAGLLTPASESASRDPSLGIAWSALQFTGADSIPLVLTDRIVRNIRSNAGLRVPFLNRPDLRNVQPYRLNPFGLASGWPTQGIDGALTQQSENRLDARVWAEWASATGHRVRLGADYSRATGTFYQGRLLSEFDLDAWIARPRRLGAFATDRVALGRLVLDVGARLDHFTAGGEIPFTPGRVFSNPAWNVSASTDDTAYANSVKRVLFSVPSRTAFAPRVHGEYSATVQTLLWADLGRVAQPPTSQELFGGSNSDLSFTGLQQPFGRDPGILLTTIAEFGVRQGIGASWSFEGSIYDERRGLYALRIKPFDDPANPGRTINFDVLTPLDGAHVWGMNGALVWRPSAPASVRAVYGFSRSAGMPFHSLAALATLHAPSGAGDQTALGRVLHDLSGTVLVRAASGLAVDFSSFEGQTSVGFVPFSTGTTISFPRFPWTKTVDVRVAKGVSIVGFRGSLYADVRNLLDLRSVVGGYAGSGAQSDAFYREDLLSPELASLRVEAENNGVLLANGAVDLRPDCATWTGSTPGPVNCAVLRGVERRFGNGDGVYDLTEQTAALNAYFDSFFGAWRFYEPGRTLRMGLEMEF